MIAISNLKDELKHRLKGMAVNSILEITTYKRNRGIVITCTGQGSYSLKEFGYEARYEVDLTKDNLIKFCLKIAKVEFPRSQQVRIYQHENSASNLISESISIRI